MWIGANIDPQRASAARGNRKSCLARRTVSPWRDSTAVDSRFRDLACARAILAAQTLASTGGARASKQVVHQIAPGCDSPECFSGQRSYARRKTRDYHDSINREAARVSVNHTARLGVRRYYSEWRI